MLAVGAIQVLMLLVALARAKFLAYAMGTQGYGIIGTIDQTIVTVVSVGSIGLPFVAVKILSRNKSESQENFERAYAGFFASLFVIGVVATAIGVGAALLAPTIFGTQIAQYRVLIAVAVVAVPSLMVNILLANALAAAGRGKQAAVFALLVQTVLLVATIFGAVLGGFRGIYIATVGCGSLLTIVATTSLRRTLGSPWRGGFGWLYSEIRRERTIPVYAFWTYAGGAVYALSLSGLRTSTFSSQGATAAGLLAAAMNLALTVGAVVNPMSNLLLTPYLNRLLPLEEKIATANDFATKMLSVVLVVSLPMALFPHFVMRVLFAPSFGSAAVVLFGFVAWQSVAQVVNILTQLLIGLDDFAFACIATIVGNAGVFFLAPWVTSHEGLPGAAMLLIGGSIACGFISGLRLWQKFHTVLSGIALFRLLFALAAIGGSWLLGRQWDETTVTGFVTRIVYGLIVLLAMTAQLSQSEKAWVTSILRGRFGRNGLANPSTL